LITRLRMRQALQALRDELAPSTGRRWLNFEAGEDAIYEWAARVIGEDWRRHDVLVVPSPAEGSPICIGQAKPRTLACRSPSPFLRCRSHAGHRHLLDRSRRWGELQAGSGKWVV